MQERPSRQDPGTNAEDSDYGRAWGSARLPQMMLSVRFKNGNRRFFAYIDLAGGDYLGDVIRLYFHHATLMIRGKGLEELAGQMERQTVRYVREQHISVYEAEETECYIERIEIGPPQLDALSQHRTG
jgi:hypothetical protein